MGKQAVAVELFYDGTWHDLVVNDEVLAGNTITIARGTNPKTTVIDLTLNNEADKFRTSNPLSSIYGKAGVNTPLRVSVAGVVRGFGQVSSWDCDQTTDFRAAPLRGSAWADVEANGLLAQINKWTRNVKSPLRVATENLAGLSGYWPCEDPAGSTLATSLVAGSRNVGLLGHSFGSQNSPPGGGTAVDLGAFPSAGYIFRPGNPASTAGWQLNRVMYLNKFTGGGVGDGLMFCNLMNGWAVGLLMDGDTRIGTVHVADTTGAEQAGFTFSTSGYQWTGRWIMMQMKATYSAGTVSIGISWRGIGDPTFIGVTDTFVGVTSDLYVAGSGLPEGSSYGHLVGTQGVASPLDSDARFDAFAGHAGEHVADRFGRLNDENNVPYYASASNGVQQGPQGADTLAHQYELMQNTEDALIFDHRTERRVFMLLRADRYNQTAALTLDAHSATHGMPSLPAEKTSDLPVNNIVTAKQITGGEFTAEDSTSPMGTQDPPLGRGEYKQDIDVNVFDLDDDLPQQAHWWLNRGTVDRPQFPTVTIDLTRLAGAQLAAVEAVDIGSVIHIVNLREYTVRLYVVGSKETIGTHTRSIAFTCEINYVFVVGKLDTNRLQAKFTTLNAGVTASATSLTLKMTDVNEQWRTGSNSVPVVIGGENITLGTVGAVTGSGPWTQAVTGCTRATNGIVKAHLAGDQVTVLNAIRLTM